MKLFTAIILLTSLYGCAHVELPAGKENQKEFVQTTNRPYRETYQVIAKQMRACYRVIGLFGNGYDIQADLDTANSSGRVELYHIGLTGASNPEDSMFSRTVTIKGEGNGSIVTTTGTTPKYVYGNHLSIASWLSGSDNCGPGQQK